MQIYLPNSALVFVFCLFVFFFFFTTTSPSVTQRPVSQENTFKKSKKPVGFFFSQTMGSNDFLFQLKIISVFKLAKFEFKVTVHYSLWAKCI